MQRVLMQSQEKRFFRKGRGEKRAVSHGFSVPPAVNEADGTMWEKSEKSACHYEKIVIL